MLDSRNNLGGHTAPFSPDFAPRVGMAPSAARMARRRLEHALSGYELAFPKLRDARVEHAAFPPMIALYWGLVENNGWLPPRQAAFGIAVAARLPTLPRAAVVARACRAYPAFVRQHHFELVLREHFILVLRGHTLDLAGLDFLIIDGGAAFGLGLSVETEAAHDWGRWKERRHAPMPSVPVLDLYADPDRYVVGRFWLHHPDQVDEVEAFINWQGLHGHTGFLRAQKTLAADPLATPKGVQGRDAV